MPKKLTDTTPTQPLKPVQPPLAPPQVEPVLSFWEKLKFHFLSNRMRYGALILALSGMFRTTLLFEGHTDVADTLKAIADLLVGTGATIMFSGATKPDSYHRAMKEQVIRTRSGRFTIR